MSASLPCDLWIDETGRPRARWTDPDSTPEQHRLLAQFLESDVGFDQHYIDRILQEGRRIARGRRSAWSCTGNAFALALGRHTSQISPIWPIDDENPPVVELPTTTLLALVEAWRNLTGQYNAGPDSPGKA